MTHHTHNIDTARLAIAAGLYIFPCDRVTKKPLMKWREQSSNEAHVIAFFEGFPAAIVGIDCGKSGLFVIDLDRNHADGIDGGESFDALIEDTGEDFPTTGPATTTPRGGCHIYLRQPMGREPLGNSNRNLPPGIDVRGEGGFVIAPGSVMADGTFYEGVAGWPDLYEAYVAGTIAYVPDWFIAGLEWRGSVPERGPSVSAWAAADAVDDDERAERLKRARGIARKIASALAMVREGSRNAELNTAVCKLAGRSAWGGMSEAEARDLLAWACVINKLTRDDGWPAFHATFDSGWRFGIANPLQPPRDRGVDTGVIIDLQPKGAALT